MAGRFYIYRRAKERNQFSSRDYRIVTIKFKINFACPSENALAIYNPTIDINVSEDPETIDSMIDRMAEKNTENMSYMTMFDGKK